jgi:hypothetical protein
VGWDARLALGVEDGAVIRSATDQGRDVHVVAAPVMPDREIVQNPLQAADRARSGDVENREVGRVSHR